jgi:VCBS repeat-containing protein
VTGALTITDPDSSDTHTITSTYNEDASRSNSSGSLSLTALQITALSNGFSATSTGWTYAVAGAALDFLDEGETVTLSFKVTATDDSGAPNNSTSEDVTITITGTNDAPTIEAFSGSYPEDDLDDLVAGINLLDTGNANDVACSSITNSEGTTSASTCRSRGCSRPAWFRWLPMARSRSTPISRMPLNSHWTAMTNSLSMER